MFESVVGKPPASITSMVRLASSASRLANTDPAVPPPTAMYSVASQIYYACQINALTNSVRR